MKKVIAIVAVIVIALVGLTSYNGNEVRKNSTGDLIAELKSGGGNVLISDKKKE